MLDVNDYLNLGHGFFNSKDYRKAHWCFDQLPPEWVEKYSNGAKSLIQIGTLDQAEALIAEGLERFPDHFSILDAQGALHISHDQINQAEALYKRLIYDRPNVPNYWQNLGYILQLQFRWEEAKQVYAKAISLFPQEVKLRTYLAMMLMADGDWHNGLNMYEARLAHDNPLPRNQRPIWTGQDLAGKTLCVFQEQGIGDCIQFCRYASLIKKEWHARKVIMVCRDPVYRLMRMVKGYDEIYTYNSESPPYDYHVAMMSIPKVVFDKFGIGDQFWSWHRYLPIKVSEPRTPPRVGLCWRGSKGHALDRYRSLSLEQLEPLRKVKGVEWVSLQYEATEDLRPWGMEPMDAPDILDVANRIADLDLVIAVDTAVAHVAGALGVECWCILYPYCDWRHLRIGNDSKWYPSMRLYRASESLLWQTAIQEMAEDLELFAAGEPK